MQQLIVLRSKILNKHIGEIRRGTVTAARGSSSLRVVIRLPRAGGNITERNTLAR